MTEKMSCHVSPENGQGFIIPDVVGSSFHQPGTVNENICFTFFNVMLSLYQLYC